MTWMPTSRAISSYFSAGACKRRAARLRQTRSSSPRAACCQTNAQSRTRCSCDELPLLATAVLVTRDHSAGGILHHSARRPWSNPAMTGIKSWNFRPLVLYQGPLGSTLHPVMAGLDPAIGHPHQFANDAIPVSNHPDRDGRVKPSQDGSGGACGTSTARAAGIRSARRANNLYSVKLRPLFRETPCWVY